MTTTTTRTCPVEPIPADPRDLVSSLLFHRLVECVMSDERVERSHAERVIIQTLAFLKACADNPGVNLSPTRAVDPGWHAFILHTEDYADFCRRTAGRFIHHRPICNDDIRSGTALARTRQAIRAAGFTLDDELWRVDLADCNQCHATCHDSP
jgi:hypothetical protein